MMTHLVNDGFYMAVCHTAKATAAKPLTLDQLSRYRPLGSLLGPDTKPAWQRLIAQH